MKVHLIKKQTIEDFVLKYADWNEPSDIVATF
ncbi:MAG: hypothetical protein ACI8WW_001972, partial [Oceanospirillaceae bacterium]